MCAVAEVRQPQRAALEAGGARAARPDDARVGRSYFTASVALPVIPLGLDAAQPVMSPSELSTCCAACGRLLPFIASCRIETSPTLNATLPFAFGAGVGVSAANCWSAAIEALPT